jgi:hypothetical protein
MLRSPSSVSALGLGGSEDKQEQPAGVRRCRVERLRSPRVIRVQAPAAPEPGGGIPFPQHGSQRNSQTRDSRPGRTRPTTPTALALTFAQRVAPVKKEEPHFGGLFGGEGGWMA